jgi:hypothetical protein
MLMGSPAIEPRSWDYNTSAQWPAIHKIEVAPPSPIPPPFHPTPVFIMNMKWIMKAIGTMTIIAGWLPKTLDDGKISVSEIIDLGTKLAAHFGVDVVHDGITV